MTAGERLPGTPVPMHTWPGHGGVEQVGTQAALYPI